MDITRALIDRKPDFFVHRLPTSRQSRTGAVLSSKPYTQMLRTSCPHAINVATGTACLGLPDRHGRLIPRVPQTRLSTCDLHSPQVRLLSIVGNLQHVKERFHPTVGTFWVSFTRPLMFASRAHQFLIWRAFTLAATGSLRALRDRSQSILGSSSGVMPLLLPAGDLRLSLQVWW